VLKNLGSEPLFALVCSALEVFDIMLEQLQQAHAPPILFCDEWSL
jgi:hypothetical protein